MRDAHAVVERQPIGDLPVVLDVELVAVVDEVPFEQLVDLRIRREDAECRVRVAEPRVNRVVRVVGEAQLPLEQLRVAELFLLLQAVVELVAGPSGVAAREARHADRDVVRADHVEEPAGVVRQARRRHSVLSPMRPPHVNVGAMCTRPLT